MKVLKTKRSFRKEFKRQIRLAIVAAIGFSIAYVWKESIFEVMQNFTINLGNTTGLGYSPLFVPILTTIFGVVLIFFLSKIFAD